MLSAERKLKIAEIINKNGGIKTSEVSSMFNVSEMTILRDLASLEEEGILTRVYGGAVLTRPAAKEIPSILREKISHDEKNKIAGLALDMVKEDGNIFLDGSTTAHALAKNFHLFDNLTVITVGLDIVNELKESANIRIICPGGELDKITQNFLGRNTEEFLKNLNADKLFMSVAGISLKAGLTEINPLQAYIKKIMISNSTQRILLIDSSKFDVIALNKVCDLDEFDAVITDKKPNRDFLDFFKNNNIEILY